MKGIYEIYDMKKEMPANNIVAEIFFKTLVPRVEEDLIKKSK